MLSLGSSKNLKVHIEERNTACVVASHVGMQNTTVCKLTIHARMIRDPIMSFWKNRNVACLRFESPKRDFINNAATAVMGREIRGNAILISLVGISAEEIKQSINDKNFCATNWSSLAKRLPAVVPLDDLARDRLRKEASEKHEAWQDYFARKKQNQLPSKSIEEYEQDDAALIADADMDQWEIEEEYAASIELSK